jgi:glycine cleavage system H lipoate-binding protein
VQETLRWVFDIREEDLFFCTADIGSIAGHSYVVYGPLALGATTLMFEGVPMYPNPDRFWEIVERYRVSVFYTTPTTIRALMRDDEAWVKRREISSLRLLGSVGEPINPEAWKWYHKNVGQERCPIMDTWWQTEAGGFLISPLPITPLKPGSATLPLPGIVPKILREDGTECDTEEAGFLVITNPWPGMLRGYWNDPDRKGFKETHFTIFPGSYFTGDGAKKDQDGYSWLMGRVDDVMHVSDYRIRRGEVEKAFASHPSVMEAAVASIPHDVKGQEIYTFVTLKKGTESSEDLRKELLAHARKVIGPIVTLDKLQFVGVLPKMRSGRIMRSILRKIGEDHLEELEGASFDSTGPQELERTRSPEAGSDAPWQRRQRGQGGKWREAFLREDLSLLNIRESLFYHPGHTWIKVEKADEVRVGLDAFLGKLIGQVKAIAIPPSGRTFAEGENLCAIIQGKGILDIVFPVGGLILSVNSKLKVQPELITEDPFGDGFLLTLKPDHFQRDRECLFYGEGVFPWYRNEGERFKTAVISEVHPGQERVGMTMQDGEIRLRDIKKMIDPERYIQLISTFLRNGEKHFPRIRYQKDVPSKFERG